MRKTQERRGTRKIRNTNSQNLWTTLHETSICCSNREGWNRQCIC